MTAPRILVTGAPRSGTTWVGRALCLGGDVTEIYEPFNPRAHRSRWFDPPEFYLYVDQTNEADYLTPVQQMASLRYPLARRVVAGDGRDALRTWREVSTARRAGRGPLVKDPIALFATPWLATRFGFQPVVLLRHPAGFVSSLLRVGWRVRFGSWLRQERLMTTLLAPWRAEIEAAQGEDDEIVAGATFWRICAGVVAAWRQEHPDWLYLRHEDLADDPARSFAGLYGRLGLSWSDDVRRAVTEQSGSQHPADVSTGQQHELHRNSRAVADVWHQRLDAGTVEQIRDIVGDVADELYPPETWLRRRTT